jgi:hypothetical protein
VLTLGAAVPGIVPTAGAQEVSDASQTLAADDIHLSDDGLMVGPVWMLLVMMVKSGYPQSEALFMVICISVSMLAEMPKARILHNGIQALNLRYGLC